MGKKMDQVFNNLQTLFKLTFIAAIFSGAKMGRYYQYLYFVNEELETCEIKSILTAKMSLVSLD